MISWGDVATHQVLDGVGLVALAPRARRRRHREDALLGGRRRAPAAAAGPAPPARPGRPVHAARRQPRSLRQLLEAGVLLPQPPVLLLQGRHARQQLDDQPLQPVGRQGIQVGQGWRGHAPSGSRRHSERKPPGAPRRTCRPVFLTGYGAMEVLYPRCAGLDVHEATVVAAVRLVAGGKVAREVRTFGTTTAGLLELAAWLSENGCTHVVMEATGVYWKPVWHILAEGGFALVLANAAQVKNVPGRKTDVGDATWLAELLAHGLVRASFVPDAPTAELRSLLRTRKQLVRERAGHVLRLQKTLEDANVKLDGVVTDLLGKSGRAMLEALAAGEGDPEKLAALAHPRLAATPERLREALRGRATRHHRFLPRLHLDQVDALDAAVGRVGREVEAR